MGPALRIILRPFGAEHHRQADVGADDPVRPRGTAPLMSRRGDVASPPTGDLPHPSVGRGPRAPPGSMHIARRDTWVPPYGSYCAPFGAEHHRQADVGADDPVRPRGTAPLMSRRGDVASPPTGDLPHPSVGRGPRAPPGSMHIARRDTWVPPYGSYCAPFGAEHHRQADVGADDPVRPNSAKRCPACQKSPNGLF